MARTLDPDTTLFAALADPTRLSIVRQLAAEGEVCACDFVACCDVAQPTVSHHLRVLREAGLVVGRRRGSWVMYRLAPGVVDRLAALVGELAAGLGSRAVGASGDVRALPVVQPSSS